MSEYVDRPIRVVHGSVEISEQLLRQAVETEQAIADIEAGRREWDPSKVDWDALEEMYEDD